MLNWRKPLIYMAFSLSGYPVFRYLKYLKTIEYKSLEELQKLQKQKLQHLLKHAYENVPYYKRILSEVGVIHGGRVILENFHKIPLLTKEVIRNEGNNLYSRDYKKRHWYYNSSGGSTGEPVKFIQDRNYQSWGMAGRFYFNLIGNKEVGEPELKLWGSERDILQGRDKVSTRLRRWIFNTELLNAYRMSNEDMMKHIERCNQVKPKQIWAYTDSMYKLSRFVEIRQLSVHFPKSIICTTANLLPQARRYIEKTFGCKVLNQYGSREVGTIACECEIQEGLHIFTPLQKLEILNSKGQPVKDEEVGEIIITTLNNYSMPLIRYRIGDTGCFSNKMCSCGRGFPLLKEVTGRVFAHFLKKDGSVIHSQFFVALFFFKPWVREFKVVQKDYELIEILVALEQEVDQGDVEVITGKIKEVMGQNCKVEFKFVDEVPPTDSGKYLYT
ncbi:MAG: phenylacetate--CoA ligase family protein, partial [Planctomycetota bacterium]